MLYGSSAAYYCCKYNDATRIIMGEGRHGRIIVIPSIEAESKTFQKRLGLLY